MDLNKRNGHVRILMAFISLAYCLENNVKHRERERERGIGEKEREREGVDRKGSGGR